MAMEVVEMLNGVVQAPPPAAPAPSAPGDPAASAPATPADPVAPAAPATPGEATPAVPAPAPDSAPDGEEQEPVEDEQLPDGERQRRRMDRAFAKERRELREAERLATQRATEYETRLRMLEQGYQRPPPPAPAPPPPDLRKPLPPEEFASNEEYLQAEVQRQVQLAWQQREQALQQHQAQQALEARQAAFRVQHPDYDQVLATHLAGRLTPGLYQALLADEDGPALAYHLARTPEQLARLNSLPPAQVGLALGRLAAALPRANGTAASAAAAGAPPATPPALMPPPPPLTPVSGTASGVPVGYSDDLSMAEYQQWRKRTFPNLR